MKIRPFSFMLALCGVLLFPLTATAEDIAGIPVSERHHPELDAVGVRVGGVMLYPSAKIIERFDSNIYATKRAKKSDLITEILPRIQIKTLNAKQGAVLDMSSHHAIHKNHTRENYTDLDAALEPYWEISRVLKMTSKLAWQQRHERRSDPDATQNVSWKPTRYRQSTGRLALRYEPGRTAFEFFGERRAIAYRNTTDAVSGIKGIQNDRDRYENAVGIELGCNLSDARSYAYWRNEWFNRDYRRGDYDAALANYSGAKRDSDGLRSVIGLRFPLTPTIRFDGNIGYRHQNFDHTQYRDDHRAIADLGLTWQVTGLTTLHANAHRDVFETIQANASTYAQTEISIGAAHELRRPLILDASIAMGRNDYNGIDRQDDYWAARVGMTYKMNRLVHWRMDYAYEERDSDDTEVEYDKHRLLLSAKIQF